MMIRLSDKLYVASDQIASVELNSYNSAIIVTMKNGQNHSYEVGYRESIFTALTNLVSKIDKE